MDVAIRKTADSVYILSNEPKDWLAAQSYAEGLIGTLSDGSTISANLVSIGSEQEQSIVGSFARDNFIYNSAFSVLYTAADGGDAAYIWLGGSDLASEGSWVWSDGSPFAYSNWGRGGLWNGSGQNREPDDFNGQDTLAMGMETWPYGYATNQGLGDALQWNDIDESNKLPFMMEFAGDLTRVFIEGLAVAFDINGNAGITAKILGAVFGADQVSNKEYAGIGLDYLDNKGYSYEGLMDLALKASGCVSNEDVVNKLYENVVGVTPTAEQAAPFVSMLEGETPLHTWGSLGVMAADLELLTTRIDLTGLAETGLEYTPFG